MAIFHGGRSSFDESGKGQKLIVSSLTRKKERERERERGREGERQRKGKYKFGALLLSG
jgi:hypothetical protein